jgi:hypothetical protein
MCSQTVDFIPFPYDRSQTGFLLLFARILQGAACKNE